MAVQKKKRQKTRSITLRDVLVHMGHMEQRLTSKIDANTKKLDEHSKILSGHSKLLSEHSSQFVSLEKNLMDRMDALEEDLTATMKDTLNIRRHVGMPLPQED